MHPLAFLLVSICFGVLGQLLMKCGTNRSGQLSFTLQSAYTAATNVFIVAGLFSYALSSVFYIVVISKLPLSYVYPMIAFSYVAVTILSRLAFGEPIPGLRWAGLAVICVGVVLLALSRSPSAQLPPGGTGVAPAAHSAAPSPGDQ